MTLSVVVITKNEENNIAGCLEAIKWADEIIVVDDYSQDKTPDIVRRYTDKIFSRKWPGFLDQRRFALGLATCDFVLILDADEILDDAGQRSVKAIINSGEDYSGYLITRDTYFMGRRLAFAEKPDPIMRLFRRDCGFVSAKFGQRGHEDYGVRGKTRLIGGRLEHYTAHTVSERVKKIDRYSTLWAAERFENNASACSSSKILSSAIRSFIGNFIIKGGFRDGLTGLTWCSLKAFENFLKYAKLFVLQSQKYAKDNTRPDIFHKLTTVFKMIKLYRAWHLAVLDGLGLLNGKILYTLRNNTKYLTRSKLDMGKINAVYIGAEYNEHIDIIKDNSTVIDIGAHIGVFSIFAETLAGDVAVYSYEPFIDNFILLEENVRLNNADKNIHIFNRGVSGKRGARRLFIDHNNPGGHSMFNESGGFIEIDTVSLSDIFDDNGLSHCDFLKMDCEGAEYEILYNTPREYLKRIKSISMEYHDNGDISGLASFLEENGFKVTFKKNKEHLLYAKRI